MTSLYLVRADDANGDNQDSFVVADDPETAVAGWLDGQEQVDQSEPSEVAEAMGGLVNVREILPDVTGTRFHGRAGVVPWHDLAIVR